MVGIDPESDCLKRAREMGIKTTADGVDGLLPHVEADGVQIAFDATSAYVHAENSRKRADKDRREAENYGGSKLARDLLPVYDALSRAIESADRSVAPELLEGVELTLRELQNVFGRHGIRVIAPAVGDRFDPQQHEAMFEAPVPGTRAGDIIQVMANGFMLHDRLLRAAQVGVSSLPAGN